jgi:uncharacterized membrane protein (DUF485 family)
MTTISFILYDNIYYFLGITNNVSLSGNYSCLGVTIKLKRRYKLFLIQVYAPSILIVILSWVSYWLNTDAIPARVSLGILTVLTVSSSGNINVGMSQRVSYIRAIDVWNAACLILVFAAVVEYAYVRRRMESVCSDKLQKVYRYTEQR